MKRIPKAASRPQKRSTRSGKRRPDPLLPLIEALRSLPPTGPEGFEGLISRLLTRLTGSTFWLSSSGTQGGKDLSSRLGNEIQVAVQCKRFTQRTALQATPLQGDMDAALIADPQLDLWALAATRSISGQVRNALEAHAVKLGISVAFLDHAPPALGALPTLCAQFADLTVQELVSDAGEQASLTALLVDIRRRPEFAQVLEETRRAFSADHLGYVTFRAALRRHFECSLQDVSTSRHQFGQIVLPLAHDALDLPRTAVEAALNGWWQNWPGDGRIAVLHGEEGTGKTWDLATWIFRQHLVTSDAPLVIWCSSENFTSSPLLELGANYIQSVSPSDQLQQQQLQKRLRQWTSASSAQPWPRVLFVVDGLNERLDHNAWRKWLSKASYDLQHTLPAAALMLTCRSSFWPPLREHLTDDLHLRDALAKPDQQTPIREIVVEPFTDPELATLLARMGLVPQELDSRMRNLLRRPRHLRLARRYWDSSVRSGDFTVERLFFEDWRDRMQGRGQQPLTDDAYQWILKNVATAWRGRTSEPALGHLLAGNPEVHAALQELISGGVFDPVPGSSAGLRLEPNRLFLGLAFSLLEQVTERGGDQFDKALEETLAYTESTGDSDESARILANAVCIALTDRGQHKVPRTVAVALLLALVRHRNGASYWQRAQPWAFFPQAPEIFQELAEAEWPKRESRAAERIAYCFVSAGEKWPASESLIGMCQRWLSLVHVASARPPEARDDEEIARYRPELPDRLSSMAASIKPLGIGLVSVADEDSLRLQELAFLVLSQVIVESGWSPGYLGPLSAWAVSSAVMGQERCLHAARWTMRLAGQSCSERILDRAFQLAAGPEPLLHLAARILLNAAASPESRAAMQQLDPQPPASTAAPATFAELCRTLADLTPADAAARLSHQALDPQVPLEGVAWQHEPLLQSIDVADLCVGSMKTRADNLLSTADPALCRTAPHAYAGKARQQVDLILSELPTRTDLRTEVLAEHFLILTSRQLATARALLPEIERDPTPGVDPDTHRAWDLASVVLAGLTTAEEQRQFLLSRGDAADDPDWSDLLSPLSSGDFDSLLRRLPEATGTARRRLTWLRWSEPFALTDDQRAQLLAASRDPAAGPFAVLPALRARDPQLLFAAIADGRIDDGMLSGILEREVWARSALTTPDRAPGDIPSVGLMSQSWLLAHQGLAPDAVRSWVGTVDRRLQGVAGRIPLATTCVVCAATLEAAIQVAPDIVESWIAALADQSGISRRLVDLHFDLVSALVVALLNLDDPRGASIFDQLLAPQSRKFSDGNSGIPSLWFLPFKARDTLAASQAALHLFDRSFTDNDLQSLAFVAARAGRLAPLIDATRASDKRLLGADRVAALVALSPHSPWATEQIEDFTSTASGAQADLAIWGRRKLHQDRWARHWFRRFAQVADRTDAWAAFRLFSQTADRRWLLWYRDELDAHEANPDIDARRRHYTLNLDDLLETTKKSWEEADKTLFGNELPSSPLLPWKGRWYL